MHIDISSKKKDIWLIITTVVIISLLINILANLLYQNFNYLDKTLFFIAVLALTIIFIIFTFFSIIAKTESKTISVTIPFTIDKNEKEFIFFKRYPPSYHIWKSFNSLSNELKNKLVDSDDIEKFWDSDLYVFINNVVQGLLITTIINNPSIRYNMFNKNGWKSFSFNNFPNELKNNPFLKNNTVRRTVIIPEWLSFKIPLNSKNKLCLLSKYGNIEFLWDISYSNGPIFSESYLLCIKNKIDDIHDFVVKINMRTTIKLKRIFSKNLEEHIRFTEYLENEIKLIDWDYTTMNIEQLLKSILLKLNPDKIFNTRNYFIINKYSN